MRSKEASKVSTSRALPYSFSGISSRSGVSCAPSANGSMRPCSSHAARQRRQITLDAGGSLVTLLGGLREQLHDDLRDRGRNLRQPLAWRHWLSGDMAVDPL